jgi:hypothetical protein
MVLIANVAADFRLRERQWLNGFLKSGPACRMFSVRPSHITYARSADPTVIP